MSLGLGSGLCQPVEVGEKEEEPASETKKDQVVAEVDHQED